ncbi:Ras family guanine nucleotide exchange factor BUD5 NDAI_0A00690 [Naumovozyma dairenensis CBS 421]|uniref:Ras GEF n=1 Tax=Naumovozyma dairenensis (strain ATCC 10597 / BCRC 20456 / CBS 421 / NBRC 0211 / NRRL Y-12639) TaxID=1071378 RepID=G0W339_NAUDC|nr:hypothetical protein NDAI_0A00690 [Naumovozyma dairenensis CBS 421]CCD22227.1 hypothetical protein NDAI_0A00690 [Naumovozyma dairenensis CBS 421]
MKLTYSQEQLLIKDENKTPTLEQHHPGRLFDDQKTPTLETFQDILKQQKKDQQKKEQEEKKDKHKTEIQAGLGLTLPIPSSKENLHINNNKNTNYETNMVNKQNHPYHNYTQKNTTTFENENNKKSIRMSLLINKHNPNNNTTSFIRNTLVRPGNETPPLNMQEKHLTTTSSRYDDPIEASNNTFSFETTINTLETNDEENSQEEEENENEEDIYLKNENSTLTTLEGTSNSYSNRQWNSNSTLEPNKQQSDKTVTHDNDDSNINKEMANFAYLFITAISSFDSSTLDDEDDREICLSFQKGDIAFVHNVDESGWGEVTLISNKQRGWIPFNYFEDTIKTEEQINTKITSIDKTSILIETKSPLKDFLSKCATFILYPKDFPLKTKNNANYNEIQSYTFNIEYINNIRTGVKTLLQMTECVSRSNELVLKNTNLKKSRKKLLASWYNLTIKADYYKRTTQDSNINKLLTLVYELIDIAFQFFRIWRNSKLELKNENEHENENEIRSKEPKKITTPINVNKDQIPNLTDPPTAKKRLNEINDILFRYIALIIGRLDLVENNPSGCELLEIITHQIILLLRELLYISKSCSYIIREKYQYAYENTFESNLDPLLSFVSELVSCIKIFVTGSLTQKLNELKPNYISLPSEKSNSPRYSSTGEKLIIILSNMGTLIATTITSCNNYLRLIGDLTLGNDRKYPNFVKIMITPEMFINKCTLEIKKRVNIQKLENSMKEMEIKDINSNTKNDKLIRFSTIRSGINNLTNSGTRLINDLIQTQEEGERTKSFSKDPIFNKYKIDANNGFENTIDPINNKETIYEELIFNKEDKIIGGSFRALIYKMTDEQNKPDDFLLSAFLLNFKIFGSANELTNDLIARFDLNDTLTQFENQTNNNNGKYSSRASKMKTRRRMVCNIFNSWMKSYWDYTEDFEILPTMINFFNEGVSEFLPIESKLLIELACKLLINRDKNIQVIKMKQLHAQLLPNIIKKSNVFSIISDTSISANSSRTSMTSLASLDENMIEDYNLTKVNTDNNEASNLELPLLNLGTFSLLSKTDVKNIEIVVQNYYKLTKMSLDDESIEPKYRVNEMIKKWITLFNKINEIPKQQFSYQSLTFAEFNSLEVAKQLTLIESALYNNVEATELINKNFFIKNKTLNRSPNVNAILSFTNQLSNYVVENVLQPNIANRIRINRLKNWLRIALSSLYFRNYNSLASIMTALQNSPITRLYYLWDELSEKDMKLYEYLSKIIHPNNNYKIYRQKIRTLKEQLDTTLEFSKSPLPVVPFFNLFLQDLTFINDGNADYRNPESFRPNKIINIDKFFKITTTISIVQYFQVKYDTNGSDPATNNRDSFFHLTEQMGVDTKNIRSIPLLQEYIFYELWRVNLAYEKNNQRGYDLSFQLLPRN